jgi:hypothetical protein
MGSYRVDRSLLESFSTEEIRRILKKERDDYTPEAVEILEEILASRGGGESSSAVVQAPRGRTPEGARQSDPAGLQMIRNPSDAVRVLNDLLAGVLGGTVDPEVARAAAQIVLALLRALEQEYMTEPEEET